MKRRQLRLGELIRDILAEKIQRELKDPRLRGLISITKVEVAPDYSEAKVMVSVFGSESDRNLSLAALRSSRRILESAVRSNCRLRVTPALRFELDDTIQKEVAFQQLLKKAMEGIPPDDPEDASDEEE